MKRGIDKLPLHPGGGRDGDKWPLDSKDSS